MKKMICLMMTMIMLLTMVSAYAEDLGVQIIGGNSDYNATSLDNMKIGETYTIDGYARIKVESFGFYDCFPQYKKGEKGNNSTPNHSTYIGGYINEFTPNENLVYDGTDVWQLGGWHYLNYYEEMLWNNSKTDADFCILVIKITNLQKEAQDFSKEAKVTVTFDEEYPFNGWIRQFNENYDTTIQRFYFDNKIKRNELKDFVWPYPVFCYAVNDPADVELINMLYTGTYLFGCTLPNSVVSDKASLRMDIELGNNELTYIIRK